MDFSKPEAKPEFSIMGGFITTDRGGVLKVRSERPDELSKPVPGAALDRPAGLGKGKRHKLVTMGISKEVLSKGDPAYANNIRLADSYRKQRQKELLHVHGYISSGTSSLLAAAALALAASRYLYEKVAETGNLELIHMAGKLSNDARQNELAAWELCSREALARRKADAGRVDAPWLNTIDLGTKRPGKKSVEMKNVETVLMLTDGDK